MTIASRLGVAVEGKRDTLRLSFHGQVFEPVRRPFPKW